MGAVEMRAVEMRAVEMGLLLSVPQGWKMEGEEGRKREERGRRA